MKKTHYKFSYTDPIGTVFTFLVVEDGEKESKVTVVNYDNSDDHFTVDTHSQTIENESAKRMTDEAKEFGDDFEEISEKSFNYEMKSIAEKLGNYLVK